VQNIIADMKKTKSEKFGLVKRLSWSY